MRTAFFSILLLLFSSTALANFNAQQQSSFSSASSQPSFGEPTFLKVEQAFPFDYVQQGETVRLTWQVTDGYYLYQERFSVNAENADIGEVQMRQGTPYQDEFFGEVNIYTEPVTLTVPVIAQQGSAKLLVQYQGCAKAGFCYPPETKVIELNPASFGQVSEQPTASTTTQSTSQENDLASLLEESQWTTPLLFLLLGIGLAFTPCVLPMYPILTSIVLGGGKQSHGRAFALSFVYVQGMALTYTLLGLVVASAGMQFQAALQHPAVLISISVLFIALALSMFGVYTCSFQARFRPN